MKIIITILFIGLSLYARSNPFESTDTFKEKKNHIINQLQEKNQPITIKSSLSIKKGCNDSYNYKLLPFITVNTNIDSFIVNIKKKYKLINQDIDLENKKLIFDFKGKTNFYTKREKLCHKYFKSFSIGCHKKEQYFRVVVELNEDVLSYKDIIDTKNNSIIIKYIK